jgi:hypothetical protein
MPWIYSQSTGQLTHNGSFITNGYSGAGFTAATGRNNAAMQDVPFQGPIPAGEYHIGNAYHHPSKGPIVMNLDPVGHNALGRTEFRIHGTNSSNNASQGCIILPPNIRSQINNSSDKVLLVQP